MDPQTLKEWESEYSRRARFNAGIAYDIERVIYAVFYEFDENQEPRFSIFSRVWKESRKRCVNNGILIIDELNNLQIRSWDSTYRLKPFDYFVTPHRRVFTRRGLSFASLNLLKWLPFPARNIKAFLRLPQK